MLVPALPTDFKAMTGCAAECAYSVDQFPTPANTSPLVTQPRNPAPAADCPAAQAGTSPIQATALVRRTCFGCWRCVSAGTAGWWHLLSRQRHLLGDIGGKRSPCSNRRRLCC